MAKTEPIKGKKARKRQAKISRNITKKSKIVGTGPLTVNPADVKNYQKRIELVERKKIELKRNRAKEKKKREQIREEQGEEALPKEQPKTVESQRVYDETFMEAEDEEVEGEEQIDEFAEYFNNERAPKILMTTNTRPKGVSR